MAEILVENQVCNACGADVREGALFCYNCGSSVALETVVTEINKKDAAGNNWQRERIVENGNNKDKTEFLEEKLEKEEKKFLIKEKSEKPISKPDLPENAKLKSAANLRRRPKTFKKQKIEVVWEEHEAAPHTLFVLAAIILTLFSIGILILALQLR
ncbi:hypothetical protein BH24ACI2_BH24ACI2_02540 [soil metagenome]|jgi:hypothetical protein|nr:zinc ribbon domain-containing protein [Acidobacteriota bacterium]